MHLKVLFLMALAMTIATTSIAQMPEAARSNGRVSSIYEEWIVSGNETMGMSGLALHFKATQYLDLGVGTWMAVRGNRGGFITLGVDAALRWPLTDQLTARTGLFLGAGGGKDGLKLAGGGLMIRPHMRLTWDVAPWLSIATGMSFVNFPYGGIISSSQPLIEASIPVTLPINAYKRTGSAGRLEDTSIAIVTRFIHPTPGSLTTGKKPQEELTLLGIELRSYLSSQTFAKVETQGAVGGNNSGYMQILAGIGYQYAIVPWLTISTDIGAGGAGGGAVETGGGVLINASTAVQANLTQHLFIGLAGTWHNAPDGTYSGTGYTIKTGYRTGGSRNPQRNVPYRMRARFVNDTYLRAAQNWRTRDRDLPVDNLGLQFDVYLNNTVYLTGQGIAAYRGRAGAYMIGLLGAGITYPGNSRLYMNTEAMLGAAGGGGLRTGSGLVWQVNAGPGIRVNPNFSVLATGGRLESFDGPFKANVLSLGLVWHFGL